MFYILENKLLCLECKELKGRGALMGEEEIVRLEEMIIFKCYLENNYVRNMCVL